jgi:NitT/TauT family transport system ATP-binding protein
MAAMIGVAIEVRRKLFPAVGEAPARLIYEDFSLAVPPGLCLGLLGRSGTGKTTLLNIVAGLDRDYEGRVAFEGGAREPRIAYVFQTPRLLPWRTALENVLLPLEIVEPYRSDFSKQKYAGKANALLESVGLRGFADKHPWELSGGMQQRTSICRALIHEPEILLLDEPFGALDAFTREELWAALRDLQAARKVTVMLVTHDLREAVFLADTVYVMSSRPGRIVRRREIPFPRPRDLEVTYTQEFQDVVHELRSLIRG